MEERKKLILNTIIKEHIKSGVPVGSEILVEKYKLDFSPATVRNEMAELEDQGFIKQPYTSAGRIPTETAYNFYLENLSDKKLAEAERRILDKLLKTKDEFNFKQAAKILAKISQTAVFWAFQRNNLYYTGISNLLHQPEFSQSKLIYNISEIIDRLDEIIDDIFDELKLGEQILLGSKNPFDPNCSTVIAKYKLDGNFGLIGLLGPVRMNYEKNLALIKFVNHRLIN